MDYRQRYIDLLLRFEGLSPEELKELETIAILVKADTLLKLKGVELI